MLRAAATSTNDKSNNTKHDSKISAATNAMNACDGRSLGRPARPGLARRPRRSKSGLIETAFVGRCSTEDVVQAAAGYRSSIEDLDEADRMANHPVLRSSPLSAPPRLLAMQLRKSRSSENKDLWSVWSGHTWHCDGDVDTASQPDLKRGSRPWWLPSAASPVTSTSCSGSWIFKPAACKRSAFLRSAPSTPPTWSEASPTASHQSKVHSVTSDELDDVVSTSSANRHIVRAVIETARTPTAEAPASTARPHPPKPPRSAPALSAKLGKLRLRHFEDVISASPPSANDSAPKAPSEAAAPPSADSTLPSVCASRLRSPLSLKARFRLDHGDDDSITTSSAESSPLRCRTGAKSNTAHGKTLVCRGAEAKPVPRLLMNLSNNNHRSTGGGGGPRRLSPAVNNGNQGGGGSSSCSSAMSSSLESIRSGTSDGVQSLRSTESSLSSDLSSLTSAARPVLEGLQRNFGGKVSKFQVLSPISDKSQEHYSEDTTELDNRTPKISPESQTHRSSVSRGLTNNSNNNAGESVDNGHGIEQALNVPWEVPKLRRRLLLQGDASNLQRCSSGFQGSDSGISVASQQQDDGADLPFDMPRLRRRADQQRLARPHSMPSAVGMVLPQPAPPPPDAFADAGDEFYLSSQNLSEATSASANDVANGDGKTSSKSLMFATNSPFALNDCEEVDPNLPLDRQDWYHGSISRVEAEECLRSHVEGSYLVRSVDVNRNEFALSLKSAKGFMHMRIRFDRGARDFRLSDFQRSFMTVSLMVHHYSRNRLPIKGAEHMCLKKPVMQQLL